MSQGLSEEFMVFVPGVTEGNEVAGLTQDFILLFCCKSGELGSKESPRFPCVTSVVGTSDFLRAVTSYYAEPY